MCNQPGRLRVLDHPILGKLTEHRVVQIAFDGQILEAIEGEPILSALAAYGIRQCRTSARRFEPRWFFCGIGHCSDCLMIVDGVPNVRTCVTSVVDGMRIETQHGAGQWSLSDD